MRISDLKRWHWIMIALAVGLACGAVRTGGTVENSIDDYQHVFTDVSQFEQAVTGQSLGYRQFTDIMVYPYDVQRHDGNNQRVYLVTGQYWDGEPRDEDGTLVAKYETACFITPSPFVSVETGKAGAAATSYATVMDYLQSLRGAGVTYHYAWWWWLATPISVWLMGSVAVIGIIWPTFINLVVFGSLFRPAEARGVSLKGVAGTSGSPPAPRPEVDPAFLQSFEKNLESDLEEAKKLADPPPVTEPPAPVEAPRPLAQSALEPAAHLEEHEKEFAAKRDDYYPTERRAHPNE